MPLGSTTADIRMINIAVTAADGSGRVWQDPTQMIPLGMNGNPEAFVAAIRAGLPLVNNLRVQFNEFSFNPDGSMNPLFERFLAAAAAQGFDVTLTYSSGDTQDIGIGDADHPALTNAAAHAALVSNFQTVSATWTKMMDWMDAHPAEAASVYGWDLMNEPAAYRHSIKANGSDALTTADFMALFVQHNAQLAELISARADGKILVAGWGYNGDFQTMATTMVGGVSALDYLRTAIGTDLVWAAHLYPGWMGTNVATDPAALTARLEVIYAALVGDDVLITETNISGTVDDTSQVVDENDTFAANMEWFAQNGIGLGWFPGANTGASHLIYVENDASITLRHQHSMAHALNGFSLGQEPAAQAGNEAINATLTTARLRNETYQIAAGEATFDALTQFGTAFGYAGADTLSGTGLSNDFLYGGSGNDVLKASAGDDFLFGQGNNDRLVGGTGIDHLFGGHGNDTLDAGAGFNVMAGGVGNDTYILRSASDTIREFAGAGTDTIQTTLRVMSLEANIENLTYTGTATFLGTGNALNNMLTGGSAADTLSGADGRDTLSGRDGDDVLTGGAGADRFVFSQSFGNDQVMDYEAGDNFVFQNVAGITTVAEALAHAQQQGADVVFDFGVDTLVLHDTTLAELTFNVN
jgi:Ca2+-binding RTX toxin-like protein